MLAAMNIADQYFREQAIEKAIERSREKQLKSEE